MSRLLILQHIEREGPGLFLDVASKLGMEIIIIKLFLGESIPIATSKDLILIMGGPMGVSDISKPQYPWIKKEISLIKDCLSEGIGVLGICLGAQLLAKAAGGTIEPLQNENQTKEIIEIGWGPVFAKRGVKKKNNNNIMRYFDSQLDVLHWHGDRIILPRGSELLAFTEKCKEQFFSIGSFAYGMQFHIEIDDYLFKKWLDEDKDFIANGLGENGEFILKEQHKEFCKRSKANRVKLIKGLLNLLTSKH